MGRKSNSKQNPKKTLGKEINKYEQQKRKDLGVVVDKLLKLTSVFQASVTPAKSWEQHLEIESILKQIQNIENPKTKSETKPRQSNVEQFVKWLSENEAQYEGVEISNFGEYGMGLKATRSFSEGSLILTVPKKLMMTENNARKSELESFISVDPLLQNMPNITLALYLLLEKSKSESFWKPYIDILPESYSTILYFTSEEILALKPSPIFESSLKMYRNIARQYAYFYNKIHTVDLPVMKKLQEIFTFDNYRWAVSTVMTRQNNLNLSSEDSTAFIPLWDMCNHEQGKITTEFNKEKDRGECFALRDFKPGEQIFIFYGIRSNADLFLHNGFVYPQNRHDSISLALGVSTSDPCRSQRLQILSKLGLASVTQYSLYRSEDSPLSAELLAFIRIFSMTPEELTKWSSEGVPGDLVSSDPPSAAAVGADVDRRAYKYLLTRCTLLRAAYKSEDLNEDATLHRRNVKLLKESEIQTLEGAIKYLQGKLESLPTVSETK